MQLLRPKVRTTVVVVDDDGATRDSFEALLGSAGYDVKTYASGLGLLKSISTVQAQCALLDLQMPHQDALAILEQIVAIERDLPVILMTSQPKSMSQVEAVQRGAVMVLEKPIEESCLLSAIQMAVDG